MEILNPCENKKREQSVELVNLPPEIIKRRQEKHIKEKFQQEVLDPAERRIAYSYHSLLPSWAQLLWILFTGFYLLHPIRI